MNCCCGHSEDEHHVATMSVPLRSNPAPIYPVTYPPFAGQPHPTATYTRMECHCGCCSYVPDHGRD